jgi:hypothetical protein
MARAFTSFYNELNSSGYHPTLEVLDNDYSCTLKDHVQPHKMSVQILEAHTHRVNAAKPTVKLTEYHTITTLPTINPVCTIQL